MSVELWAVQIERPLAEKEMDGLVGLLPAFRRERLKKLRRAEKRQEVLCAYLLLRRALQEYCGWSEWPKFAFLDSGKPYFPVESGVHFSLSHTGGAAFVGLAETAIGVDIERIRPLRKATIRSLGEEYTRDEFFRSWVRREALAKCRGSGLAGMLRAEPQLQPGECCSAVDLFPGYAAGIALREDIGDAAVRIVSQEEIIKRG